MGTKISIPEILLNVKILFFGTAAYSDVLPALADVRDGQYLDVLPALADVRDGQYLDVLPALADVRDGQYLETREET
jgi:hypothetical protein